MPVLPLFRPAAVVLRALCATSRHPALRPLTVRRLALTPAGHARTPPPAHLNNFSRLLMPSSWDYFTSSTAPANVAASFFDPVSIGLHSEAGAATRARQVTLHRSHPLPDFPRICAVLSALDDRRPWWEQEVFTDPGQFLMTEPSCVLWLTPPRPQALGRSPVPAPPSADAPPSLLAIVVNNTATRDEELIDIESSIRLTGGQCGPEIRAVAAYVLDWLGVLFHPEGAATVKTEADLALGAGRPVRPGRPPKLAADPAAPSAPAAPRAGPGRPSLAAASLSCVYWRVVDLADELAGDGQSAAADVVRSLVTGIPVPPRLQSAPPPAPVPPDDLTLTA